ncbi:LAFE_0G17942g1_1 [Lachancea fermentati]|uniref:LAFE_0G17942g1_1 n=1 Tax=Lachancea fermentati TaxID=4955 RepID=A0A1G4MIT9_LACFM|nr:LAFE_0G17942g1_1 [Lachancea fermentati]
MEPPSAPPAPSSPSSAEYPRLRPLPRPPPPDPPMQTAAASLAPPPRRKRFSLNVSAPTSPISPPAAAFPFDDASRFSTRPSTARLSPSRPSSTYGVPASGPLPAARNSFYRVPSDDHRNASLDSLSDSSSIKLLLIGDAAVGKTAMILSYANELPTRSQLSIVSSAAVRKPPATRNKLQNLKTIEKRKRYSLNDYEELFHNPASSPSLLEPTAPSDPPSLDFDPNEIVIDTRSTIGVDIKTNLVNIDNRYFKIIMWDTAGQERYRNAMIPSLYKGSNGILLSYDICNKVSFESCCTHWLREVLDNCPNLHKLRFYLVGNKIDLYKVRQVTHEDVLHYIHTIQDQFGITIAGNFEVSCKWHQVVERTFNIIIKDLVEHGCYEDDQFSHPPKPLVVSAQPNDSQDVVSLEASDHSDSHSDNGVTIRRRETFNNDTIDITRPCHLDNNNNKPTCCV